MRSYDVDVNIRKLTLLGKEMKPQFDHYVHHEFLASMMKQLGFKDLVEQHIKGKKTSIATDDDSRVIECAYGPVKMYSRSREVWHYRCLPSFSMPNTLPVCLTVESGNRLSR